MIGLEYYLYCFLVFLSGYVLNGIYITVFYHRGFTHQAIVLNKIPQKFIVYTAPWVTGLDVKAWACMHRYHHDFSDKEGDPHSPYISGFWGIVLQQLRSYEKYLAGLIRGRKAYLEKVKDLDFEVNWFHRKNMWWLPYVVHGFIGLMMGFFLNAWLLGFCYWLGLMSHPVQGFLVNSVCHCFGYQNFSTDDQSRNNFLIGWMVIGEGWHNNHHGNPGSPKFSFKWFEFDLGWVFCQLFEILGILKINRSQIPKKAEAV